MREGRFPNGCRVRYAKKKKKQSPATQWWFVTKENLKVIEEEKLSNWFKEKINIMYYIL